MVGLGFNTSGTPLADLSAFSGTPYGVTTEKAGDPSKYSTWNGDWKGYLEFMADKGDSSAQDKLFNYLMSENSAQIARKWTENREDTQYQRLVDDLKAAGINPYSLLTGSASPVSSSSSGSSYGGSYSSNYDIKERNLQVQMLKIALSFLPVFGSIVSAML